jgi:hypothetical protein
MRPVGGFAARLGNNMGVIQGGFKHLRKLRKSAAAADFPSNPPV